MCGIFVFYGNKFTQKGILRGRHKKCLCKNFEKLKHRGPDQSSIKYYNENVMVGFHRLQIVDPTSDGMQPFQSNNGRFVCVVNGEIYNFKELEDDLHNDPTYDYRPTSHSDCEVVVHYFEYILHMNSSNSSKVEATTTISKESDDEHLTGLSTLCKKLDGEFAFVIYDTETNMLFYGVDELRVRPLFMGICDDGSYGFASEQKCLTSSIYKMIRPIPSGTVGFIQTRVGGTSKYQELDYYPFGLLRSRSKFRTDMSYEDAAHRLRKLLVDNVHRKLNQRDREFGFLLSGGLDSSLICSIASKLLYPIRIRTFTVGFSEDAPDVIAAREVAKHIDSIHQEIILPYSAGIDELKNVVYYSESWDQTTNRASIPMRLALLKMKKLHSNLAIVYSGELADELLRGYLYNLKSPNPIEGRVEAIDRCQDITYFDGLRADRMVSSVGCELRLPFFGKDLLNFVFSLPPKYLDPKSNDNVEKKLLRDAFSNDENGTPLDYLPDSVLWRTKNALSDATSLQSGWKEEVKKYADTQVSDSRFGCRKRLYNYCTPQTKEDMLYRELFDDFGYDEKCIPRKWMPSWCGEHLTDSSATVLEVFHED